MTTPQMLSFGLVAAMLALFMWDKIRYDLVAMLILLAAVLLGVVKSDHAFSGFSNPVIIIIASVLIVSAAISSSGVLDGAMNWIMARAKSTSAQVGVLTACVTFLSAFIKNVGTLGIFMPIALQTARKSKRSPSIYLMPLAFGSLIGGTITKIGTSPNLLISSVREQNGGEPFRLFDFFWVGFPLSCLAVLFLMFAWRLVPQRVAAASNQDQIDAHHYTTELRLAEGSPLIGKTVADLEALGEDDLVVATIIRDSGHEYFPSRFWVLYKNDIITVRGGAGAVKTAVEKAKLEIVGADELVAPEDEHHADLDTVEAVIMEDSPLIGTTAGMLRIRRRFDINLLAVSRAGETISGVRQHRFRTGDVLVLQGWGERLREAIGELRCLPLADRGLKGFGKRTQGIVSLVVLAVAMVLITMKLVTVGVGFFGAAVVVMLLNQISLNDAYEAIEWPVIIMLGCLIPVGEGLKETGATDLVANLLTTWSQMLPGILALGLMIVVSMLLTPFLHHAAAVLVLGPIAAVLANNLGYSADPFLMAVALGCACDFLTPIGHQNNLLVMGPGGYRFSDYWRLGLPLTILVAVFGTLLIAWVWPL